MKKVLLLGRKPILVEAVSDQLQVEGVTLYSGTGIEEVRDLFEKEAIDIVIMGAGLPIDLRCEIVKTVASLSETTTIHLKDRQSGPQGMVPFVNGVLNGILA
jgi:DNA-binding response OmpR family regulator